MFASVFRAITVVAASVCIAFSAQADIFMHSASPLNTAPDFASFAGKPALIVLIQPHCGHCIAQMRTLERYGETHTEFSILAVSQYGSREALLAEVRQAGTDIPAYISSPELLRDLGHPRSAPRTFLINAQGEIVVAARGTQSLAQVDNFTQFLYE